MINREAYNPERPVLESQMTERSVSATAAAEERPLIVHLIYRLDVGGLENGLVNLINRLPDARYRHAVVCLTDSTGFGQRIRRDDVPVHALHKRQGKDLGVYFRLWRYLRRIRPDLVHTRNLAALDCVLAAVLAGVPRRIHGEHGRDMRDVDGGSFKYRALRRFLSPLVHRFVPLSLELQDYLVHRVGVAPEKIRLICNGVDTELFQPARNGRAALPVDGFAPPESWVIGTVLRMEAVKDPLTLVRAFLLLLQLPEARERLRLVMIGDGSLRPEIEAVLRSANAERSVWLPGSRDDVPSLMRAMDMFVLPSIAEGISNTILEAMASGLPVVATRVGGNPELVVEGKTGYLVPPSDPEAMASAILAYSRDETKRLAHGQEGRRRAVERFSIDRMVGEYDSMYREILERR